jgi:hypothetical protein
LLPPALDQQRQILVLPRQGRQARIPHVLRPPPVLLRLSWHE